jgi:CheY-like chemotaxis protein
VESAAQHSVLIISPMADAPRVADSLASTLGCSVNVASTHRAGLVALRHRDYSVVVVDDCLAEANPAAAELLWQSFGMAVPLQINFAFSGGARLAREVQAAIGRREQQQVMALRAAASLLENDLKSTLTGLLLQSQLALAEPELPPRLAGKLELVAELAGSLRRRLEQAQA